MIPIADYVHQPGAGGRERYILPRFGRVDSGVAVDLWDADQRSLGELAAPTLRHSFGWNEPLFRDTVRQFAREHNWRNRAFGLTIVVLVWRFGGVATAERLRDDAPGPA